MVRKRWLVFALAIGLATFALARLRSITGLVTPVVVAGGSMAEALRGRHLRVVCPDCRIEFPCDADELPANDELICPNCGARCHDLNDFVLQPPDRVWVDRWPYLWQTPARWELVAVRQPDRPGEWAVKRIVAFPGEQIAIRDGDLFVARPPAAPRVLQKSLDQWRQTAVLVHDERFTPARSQLASTQAAHDTSPSPAIRWAPRNRLSNWSRSPEGWSFAPTRIPAPNATEQPFGSCDWLAFRNIVCHDNPRRREEEPVMDNDGYNQAGSRRLHPVRDLGLGVSARLAPSATLVVVIDDGADLWAAELAGRNDAARLFRGGRAEKAVATSWTAVGAFPLPSPIANRDIAVEFARCDEQILLGVDGWSVARVDCPANARAAHPTSRPLAIGAAHGTARIGHPRVFRDIHYLPPATDVPEWSRQLSSNEYFLLGDNPPISVDSRVWPTNSITRSTLLGRVIPLARNTLPSAPPSP